MIAKGGWQASATDLDLMDLSLAPPNRPALAPHEIAYHDAGNQS
jgi:hypothetical protein